MVTGFFLEEIIFNLLLVGMAQEDFAHLTEAGSKVLPPAPD